MAENQPSKSWPIFAELSTHRTLLWELSLRTLKAPIRASKLGWVWLLLQPLLMMALYTVVFAKIYGGRYGDAANETVWDYAIAIYLSLTIFSLAADVIGTAPSILDTHRNTMRRSNIPAKVIVAAHVVASLLRFLPNLALSLITVSIFSQLHATAIWIVPMLFGFSLFLLGTAYILSSLGAVYGDVRQLAGLMCTILLWSSAVFYSARHIPVALQYINPVLQAVELTRTSAMWGAEHSRLAAATGVIWGYALVAHSFGLWLLRRMHSRITE